MSKEAYQAKITGSRVARAMMTNKPVSVKYATEIAREIKGKPVKIAESFLQRIKDKESFLPLRQYKKKVPHRRGNPLSQTKSGRFPQTTTKAFLELLGYAKANAANQGLDEEKLLVVHAFASHGFHRISHQAKGKIGGKARKKKSAHLEIIVREADGL